MGKEYLAELMNVPRKLCKTPDIKRLALLARREKSQQCLRDTARLSRAEKAFWNHHTGTEERTVDVTVSSSSTMAVNTCQPCVGAGRARPLGNTCMHMHIRPQSRKLSSKLGSPTTQRACDLTRT